MESVFTPLISGAFAGLSVDLSLYPIDTVKTRLQSKQGFFKAGGFKRLYSGVGSVMIGSTPGAAVFFMGYESIRHLLRKHVSHTSLTHKIVFDMTAASVGEVLACLVRVPTEVIKQRAQVNTGKSSLMVLRKCIHEEGLPGLYCGYRSTVLREIPFSIIQFPLWEFFKSKVAKRQINNSVTAWQSAWCGFFAGGLAAGMTTPLDVAKTRIMLTQTRNITASSKILSVLYDIGKNEGIHVLFSGVLPRVLVVSVGGFIFLGMYDLVSTSIKSHSGGIKPLSDH